MCVPSIATRIYEHKEQYRTYLTAHCVVYIMNAQEHARGLAGSINVGIQFIIGALAKSVSAALNAIYDTFRKRQEAIHLIINAYLQEWERLSELNPANGGWSAAHTRAACIAALPFLSMYMAFKGLVRSLSRT